MEQKRGEGNKHFKKGGGKLGQGVGALKRGAAGTPLQTMHSINCTLTFSLFKQLNSVKNVPFLG